MSLATTYMAMASVLQMFLELIPSTSPNGSLKNFNIWRVSVGNRTLWRDFLGIGRQKIWAQKLPIFDDFTTQWQIWRPMSPARNVI